MGKKFNEILIGLRKSSGLTQEEFAKKIGVSRSAIGNYEKGVRRPDFETTEAIADYFNVSLGYLMGRDFVSSRVIFYAILYVKSDKSFIISTPEEPHK